MMWNEAKDGGSALNYCERHNFKSVAFHWLCIVQFPFQTFRMKLCFSVFCCSADNRTLVVLHALFVSPFISGKTA